MSSAPETGAVRSTLTVVVAVLVMSESVAVPLTTWPPPSPTATGGLHETSRTVSPQAKLTVTTGAFVQPRGLAAGAITGVIVGGVRSEITGPTLDQPLGSTPPSTDLTWNQTCPSGTASEVEVAAPTFEPASGGAEPTVTAAS